MSSHEDLDIAIQFLKSIETSDPKTDLEIRLVVRRLEALTDATTHVTGARPGQDRRDAGERLHAEPPHDGRR
jgi:hypothetical protein